MEREMLSQPPAGQPIPTEAQNIWVKKPFWIPSQWSLQMTRGSAGSDSTTWGTPGKNCPAKPNQPSWEIMINFCFKRLSFGMVCHTMLTETIGFQEYFICTNHYDQFLLTTYYMSNTVLSILHLFHLIFTRTLWDSTYYYSLHLLYMWERFRGVKPKVTQLVNGKARNKSQQSNPKPHTITHCFALHIQGVVTTYSECLN